MLCYENEVANFDALISPQKVCESQKTKSRKAKHLQYFLHPANLPVLELHFDAVGMKTTLSQ